MPTTQQLHIASTRLIKERTSTIKAPVPYRRGVGNDSLYPSVPITQTPCNTSKREPSRYTGTEIIGIATMHKSNAVPVTNSAAAKDIAKMRR